MFDSLSFGCGAFHISPLLILLQFSCSKQGQKHGPRPSQSLSCLHCVSLLGSPTEQSKAWLPGSYTVHLFSSGIRQLLGKELQHCSGNMYLAGVHTKALPSSRCCNFWSPAYFNYSGCWSGFQHGEPKMSPWLHIFSTAESTATDLGSIFSLPKFHNSWFSNFQLLSSAPGNPLTITALCFQSFEEIITHHLKKNIFVGSCQGCSVRWEKKELKQSALQHLSWKKKDVKYPGHILAICIRFNKEQESRQNIFVHNTTGSERALLTGATEGSVKRNSIAHLCPTKISFPKSAELYYSLPDQSTLAIPTSTPQSCACLLIASLYPISSPWHLLAASLCQDL